MERRQGYWRGSDVMERVYGEPREGGEARMNSRKDTER